MLCNFNPSRNTFFCVNLSRESTIPEESSWDTLKAGSRIPIPLINVGKCCRCFLSTQGKKEPIFNTGDNLLGAPTFPSGIAASLKYDYDFASFKCPNRCSRSKYCCVRNRPYVSKLISSFFSFRFF